MWCLRAGRGCDGVVGGFLCCVPLIVFFTGLLKDTFRVVFLKTALASGEGSTAWLDKV